MGFFMSAKQVSSGYVLWKTGPEPVRHSHRERARLLTAAPTGIAKAHRRQVLSGRGIRRRRQYGGNRLPQPVPIPKKRLENSAEKAGLFQLVSVPKRFPGIVWKNQADQAVPAPVPKKPPGQDRPAALVPKRPSGGSSPQTPAQKNTRKVIGPSGCSVM